MTESGFDTMGTPDEQDVRNLRDFVFDSPTGGNNWSHCKDNWMRPDALRWLKEQSAIIASRRDLTYEKSLIYKSKFNA